MNRPVDWKAFEYKFSTDPRPAFEGLAYILFCHEFKQTYGIFRYYNQPYIETQPANTADGHKVGFQAKYYDAGTQMSSKEQDLKDAIKGAKNNFEIVDTNILQERRKQNRNVINNYSYIRYTYQLAVASTSGFTACAQEFAATHRISLIEFNKLSFWNGLMEILGEDKENVAIEEDKLKKIVKQISSHMAVAITNIGQLLFLYCQNGNEEVDFETNEYDISFKNKNEPWTLKCGNKEYSFQLPEHIAESWIEYSEYEIKRKKEVIESTEKPVSNMIVYYRRNEKPVIKMLSIDEDKLQEARKKLDETTKKRES